MRECKIFLTKALWFLPLLPICWIAGTKVFLATIMMVALLLSITCLTILTCNTVTFGLVLSIFIIISLCSFLFQQLWMYGISQNTIIITALPYLIAGVIYVRYLTRSIFVNRNVVKIKFKRKMCPQELFLVCLIGISAMQIFNPAIGLSAGIKGFLMGPFWMFFYFVGKYSLGRHSDKIAIGVLKTIMIVVGFSALYGIIGQLVNYPWYLTYLANVDSSSLNAIMSKRMGSSIGRPAVSGMAAMIGFLVTFSWLISSRRRHRYLILGLVVLSLIMVVASGSRSAMLGTFTGVSVIALFKKWKTLSHILLIMTIICTVGLVSSVGMQNKMAVTSISRLATISPTQLISGNVFQERNLSARLKHWSSIMPIIFQHPLGQGTGSWHQASNFDGIQIGTVADNEYLALTGELGFLGLFFFIAFTGTLGRQCWRVLRSHRKRGGNRGVWALISASTLVGVLLMSVACHPLYTFPSTMLIWLLWGMGSRYMEFSVQPTQHFSR